LIKSALKVYGLLFLFIPLALSPLLLHAEKELEMKKELKFNPSAIVMNILAEI